MTDVGESPLKRAVALHVAETQALALARETRELVVVLQTEMVAQRELIVSQESNIADTRTRIAQVEFLLTREQEGVAPLRALLERAAARDLEVSQALAKLDGLLTNLAGPVSA